MKIIAITQARFSSSRLPGKVLKKLGSKTALDIHLRRIKKSKLITDFIVATTNEPESKEIEAIALAQGFLCFHGNTDDVLDRFYESCRQFNPDYIVRLTSDCPLVDPIYIDDLIEKFLKSSVDYAANCLVPTLPDGMDAEIFSFQSLSKAWREADKKSEREHVTTYIRNSGKFKTMSVEYPVDCSKFRLTLDTPEDFDVLKKVIEIGGEDGSTEDYVKILSIHSEIRKINSMYERNEGLKKSLNEDSSVKTNN